LLAVLSVGEQDEFCPLPSERSFWENCGVPKMVLQNSRRYSGRRRRGKPNRGDPPLSSIYCFGGQLRELIAQSFHLQDQFSQIVAGTRPEPLRLDLLQSSQQESPQSQDWLCEVTHARGPPDLFLPAVASSISDTHVGAKINTINKYKLNRQPASRQGAPASRQGADAHGASYCSRPNCRSCRTSRQGAGITSRWPRAPPPRPVSDA